MSNQPLTDLSRRYGFSIAAVSSMLESVEKGNCTMAQFEHPEFGGRGQWMRGGMTMISDMFNAPLKDRVDGLCSELSKLVVNDATVTRGESFQTQTQEGHPQVTIDVGRDQADGTAPAVGAARQTQTGTGPADPVSLFVLAPDPGRRWWGADLGTPNSTGVQNKVRYAYFARPRRLAIELNGEVTIYDTLDHHIGSFSQQQSDRASLSFHSQDGLVDVGTLPIVT